MGGQGFKFASSLWKGKTAFDNSQESLKRAWHAMLFCYASWNSSSDSEKTFSYLHTLQITIERKGDHEGGDQRQ